MKTKKTEFEILMNAGIEIVGEGNSISGELETRQNTRRKINRSIDNQVTGGNHYDVFTFSADDLYKMQQENNHFIEKLIALKKETSPFKGIVPKQSNKIEVGAIMVDSWGWEQTNIDFYCVVKVSASMITVLPMSKITSAEIGFMTNEETPNEIKFTAEPIRKKVKYYSSGEPVFSFRDYAGGGICKLWKGKPETSTHYA